MVGGHDRLRCLVDMVGSHGGWAWWVDMIG